MDSGRWGSVPKPSEHSDSPISNFVMIELNLVNWDVCQWWWWEGEFFRDSFQGLLLI